MPNSGSRKVIPREIERIVRAMCTSLESRYSSLMVKAIETGNFDEVVNIYCDPNTYSNAHDYLRDQTLACFFKKCADVPTTFDRREAAVKKWYEGEHDCFVSNLRLARYLPAHTGSDSQGGVLDFISSVRKLVVEMIGHSPPPYNTLRRIREDEFEGYFEGRFGPGTTFSDRGKLSTAADKMSSCPSVTASAYTFGVSNLIGTLWLKRLLARGGDFQLVEGNRFTTVPKTAKTDRAIAAEPSVNIYYQLAYGSALKASLRKRVGWDLTKVQEIHKRVACESSVDRKFCTIDLSNASDTVSKTLVEVLLPAAWFRALNTLRSAKTLIDGKWVLLEKFSSMGNGFTFELETVIFAALCCAITRHYGFPGKLGEDVFVFGDDIIVRDELYTEVKACLEFFGFKLNSEKSFFGSSPFRESCGGDYFNGSDVRGVYLGEYPSKPSDYFVLANQIYKARDRFASFGNDCLLSSWLRTLDALPSDLRRLRGPASLGDIVIRDDDTSRWQTRYTFGKYKVPRNPWWKPSYKYPENVGQGGNKEIQVYVGKPLKFIKWGHFHPDIVLACAILGVGDGRCGITPRDPELSFGLEWAACP